MENGPAAVNGEGLLYERVANRVAAMIEDGTLRPGDRVPSVRAMRDALSVSLSTVLEAYRLLEDRGLIRARPQSGYFVRSPVPARLPEPEASKCPGRARFVERSLAQRMSERVGKPGMVQLGSAMPGLEFMPVAALNRAMAREARRDAGAHAYTEPAGCERLRREIARRMIGAGCTLGADDLIVTAGATEAIHLCLSAVTSPGDVVAVESPGYYGFFETLAALHLKAREIPTDPRTGIDVDALGEALAGERIAAVLVSPNFSNPTGSLVPEDGKRRIAELAARHGVPVIEDDVYGDLPFDGERPHAIKAYDRDDASGGLVLYCSSFSKTIAPGLRVGWCAPGRFYERVERLKMTTSFAAATLPQLTVASFLANGGYDRAVRRIRRIYREQVDRVTAAVAEHFPEGTRAARPQGAHVLWVQMPAGVDAVTLSERACEHGVSIAAGPMFSARGAYADCLRLNCGVPWSDQVEAAIRTVGELAKGMLGGAAARPKAVRILPARAGA